MDLGLSIRDNRESRGADHETSYDRHSVRGTPGAVSRENSRGKESADPDEQEDATKQEDTMKRQKTTRSALRDEYIHLDVHVHVGQDVVVDVTDLPKPKWVQKKWTGAAFALLVSARGTKLYVLRVLQMMGLTCTS